MPTLFSFRLLRFRLVSLAGLFIAACSNIAIAVEVRYLPLQQAGQASVAIDETTGTAYIVDLGKSGDGNRIKIGDQPLLDWIESQGVKRLKFVCSHPHADHMGGIFALFKDPSVFFENGDFERPKFESILVVDSAMPNSLYGKIVAASATNPKIRAAFGRNGKIRLDHRSAEGANAFQDLPKSENNIFVETIPYTPAPGLAPHGHAVVTRMVLANGNVNLDFDDSDTAVIKQVTQKLVARGDGRIDTVVVPHHGSAYHDIEPILALNPKSAIITVNASNPYGHPAPKILLALMDKLGAENVYFTGSVDHISIGPKGIAHGAFTAAKRDSYLAFIRPNLVKALEKKKLTQADADDYHELYTRMYGADSDVPLPASASNGGPPRPGAPEISLAAQRIEQTGSLLTPEFEAGSIPTGGRTTESLRSDQIFGAMPSVGVAKTVIVSRMPSATGEGNRATMEALAFRGVKLGEVRGVLVKPESASGITDGWAFPIESALPQFPAKPGAASPPGSSRPRPGGMVDLTGDRVVTADSANRLQGGAVGVCGTRICVKSAGTPSETYVLPFAANSLFGEVWERVVDRKIDTLYLSINPTKSYLKDPTAFPIPNDRLQFGGNESAQVSHPNKVVTSGDIAKSQIGRILWESDVAFKSEALGFNVFTGAQGNAGTEDNLIENTQATPLDLFTPQRDRWCRLYWTSGEQTIGVDPAAKSVQLTGPAVIARAEGMSLVDGVLKDAPEGTWCGDMKRVAARLEREALSARSLKYPVLNELRQVAEMQNFSRWARDHGLRASADIATLSANANDKPFQVPVWTSGIQSQTKLEIQQEELFSGRSKTLRIHYSGAGDPRVTKCKKQYWPTEPELIARGCKHGDDGMWKDCDQQFDALWTALPVQLKQCEDAKLLPARLSVNHGMPSIYSAARPAVEIELIPHATASEIHGGVALGMQKAFLESAWKQERKLLAPDGKLLFQQTGDEIHFWNFSDQFGEHVVISAGKILAARAADGALRFVINVLPGATVRQELRAVTKQFPRGLEWAESRDAGDGSMLMEKVAWPCSEVCIGVADISLEDLGKRMGLEEVDQPLINIDHRDAIWIVELDISGFEARLRKDAAQRTPETSLAVAQELARWGFSNTAARIYDEAFSELANDTQDTVFGNAFTLRFSSFVEAILAAMTSGEQDEILKRIEGGTASLSNTMRQLARLQGDIDRLTPEDQVDGLKKSITICDRLLPTATSSGQKESVRREKSRYEALARMAEYMSMELRNPWEPN